MKDEEEVEYMVGPVTVKYARTWLCRNCGERVARGLDGEIKHLTGTYRCYDKGGVLIVPITEATPTDWS